MKLLIIATLIIGLLVVVGTIIIGDKLFDGTVVDKPYDKGIKWDKTQSVQQKIIVTPETKALAKGTNLFVFTITKNDGTPVKLPVVSVTRTRPHTTRFDWTEEARLNADNKYSTNIDINDFGQWQIRVSFDYENETLSYVFPYMVKSRDYEALKSKSGFVE
ncbi:MAG: FixH family protein [Thermodesulfovibrionales bacterium]|nr:FixH family protein [Thermodesulfovibrionales bacterium]